MRPSRPEGSSEAIGHVAARVACGLILLTAATLKARELAGVATAASPARWATAGGVALESALGLWLVSGVHPRLSRWAAALAFAGFACVAAAKVAAAEESCGCFGRVRVDPRLTLALDVGAAVALAYPSPRDRESRLKAARRLAYVLLLPATALTPSLMALARQGAATQTPEGDVFGGGTVVLRPERWIGAPLPLLDRIDRGDDLRRGEWYVVFHRHGCPACEEIRPRLRRKARDLASVPGSTRIALVELPPRGEPTTDAADPWLSASLDGGRTYHVNTPLILHLKDSAVVRIVSDLGD